MLAACSLCAAAEHIEIADSLVGSEIYPGTVHNYLITVPHSYTGREPAGLYLGLDGVLCGAPAVLDSLARAGKPFIGVFLQPGIVRNTAGDIVRYNRSNEFDATDGRFARFLATELLPAVERITTPDGRHIRLTADPARRVIFGLSSGGIAALTAAWHRPDLFGCVLSGCGTFVPMRGGHNLQAIVRKHEPLPIRVFLQDGFDDCWNPTFGSWFDANATLGTALRFAGYDLAVDWAEGVHSVRRATEIFPDALRWLLRPAVPARLTGNDVLAPILANSGPWEQIEAPAGFAPAKPEAIYPDGSLRACAARGTNYLTQEIIAPDGRAQFSQPFYWLHSYTNSALTFGGMVFDGLGNLWVITDAGMQICDQNGRVRGILRLPADFPVAGSRLELKEGAAIITGITPAGSTISYRRTLTVVVPTHGQKPVSQGQG